MMNHTHVPARKSYTVAFRLGGSLNGSWHKAIPVSTWAAAKSQADAIQAGGRIAYIYDTEQLEAIGLPEGYSYNAKGSLPDQTNEDFHSFLLTSLR